MFDVTPYLDKGIFQELRDMRLFNSVRPFLGSIQWQNGQDFGGGYILTDSWHLFKHSFALHVEYNVFSSQMLFCE